MLNKDALKDTMKKIIKIDYGKTLEKAKDHEKYVALSKGIMEQIVDRWIDTKGTYEKNKEAYYLSAEFLMGRALGNNLINLGIYEDVKELLNEMNIDINKVEEIEEDAGLGNGGLGRLAACFMDSAATCDVPLTGYGIRYSHGIFRQKIVDGFQVEKGDNWLKYGDPWSIRREENTVLVRFADQIVKAIPYDTPVIGYGTNNINTLRLWQCEPLVDFDFELFNEQKYEEAVRGKNKAQDISRVLYPNDSNDDGKILRLKQQYFFVSASLQDLIRKHKSLNRDLLDFAEYNSVQLNDTHPTVAIPEMMRLLVDDEELSWEDAWEVTRKTFAYTNHTILSEALEKWWNGYFKRILPRIYEIIEKIDEEFIRELKAKTYEKEKIAEMRIVRDDMIRMAHLAIHGTYATNGVAQLHTDILKETELNDWYKLYPERFQNKTNGITPRRWIRLCNKELSSLITELLGTEEWVKDLDLLKNLEKYYNNQEILERFLSIKDEKKRELADYIKTHEGIDVDSKSIFDIQIKRLHEYKRQLLKAFYILDLYYRLKENKAMDITPRTFVFGAKAAPGYFRAKGVIKFINEIANLINNDKEVNEKIKVIFVQNYRVSYAEKLFPAADVSEQISTAGKEASGTGNMKFMLNGTPTLGTYDGANVEIVAEAGEENNFIFGLRVEDIKEMKDSYDPKKYYEEVPALRRVVDTLIDGTFSDGGTGMFKELYTSLLEGASWHTADNYFIFADFNMYKEAQDKVDNSYKNRLEWAKKCWLNMANAGKFSSDRTILQYADEIWNVDQNPIK